MSLKPIILTALFVILLFVIFNPPGSGGADKHGDRGGKPGSKGPAKKH